MTDNLHERLRRGLATVRALLAADAPDDWLEVENALATALAAVPVTTADDARAALATVIEDARAERFDLPARHLLALEHVACWTQLVRLRERHGGG